MTSFASHFRNLVVFALLTAFWAPLCYAWPPTFGGEFNFSSRKIVSSHPKGDVTSSPESREARDQMMKIMKVICENRGDCHIETLEDKYENISHRVIYTDGWWFQIGTDPMVVEIQTKPSTVAELKSLRNRIQNDIFGTAGQAGLFTAGKIMDRLWAAGHIHMGVDSAFNGNPVLFRNFFADYSNHSELAYGIFAQDATNAPPLAILPTEKQSKAKEILALFDAGKIKQIPALAKRILKEVYDVTTVHLGNPQKFQAYNFTRIGNKQFPEDEQTVETRGIGPQESADDFIAEAELIERRLEYVDRQGGQIPLDLKDPRTMNAFEKVSKFYEYVTQSRLPFTYYRKFIEANPVLKPVLKQVLTQALKTQNKCEKVFFF